MNYEQFIKFMSEGLNHDDNLDEIYAYMLYLESHKEIDWEDEINELDFSDLGNRLPEMEGCYIFNEDNASDYIEDYVESQREEIEERLQRDELSHLIPFIDFETYFSDENLGSIYGDVFKVEVNGETYQIVEF